MVAKKIIIADENMSRLFTYRWKPVLERLEAYGYEVRPLPSYLRGASDRAIAEYIVSHGYDGIITEDTDFRETHRSDLLWKLTNKNKVVLVVRRVNPNMKRGEVRVYLYEKNWLNDVEKRELFRLVIDY